MLHECQKLLLLTEGHDGQWAQQNLQVLISLPINSSSSTCLVFSDDPTP